MNDEHDLDVWPPEPGSIITHDFRDDDRDEVDPVGKPIGDDD